MWSRSVNWCLTKETEVSADVWDLWLAKDIVLFFDLNFPGCINLYESVYIYLCVYCVNGQETLRARNCDSAAPAVISSASSSLPVAVSCSPPDAAAAGGEIVVPVFAMQTPIDP